MELTLLREILTTVGIGGVVVIIIAYAIQKIMQVWAERQTAQTRQFNATTQQEEIVNSLVLRFDNDIRLMRDQHNFEIRDIRDKHDALQGQFHETDKELAREQGRRDQMEKQLNQQNERIEKQGSEILELGKRQKMDEARIKELETEIAELTQQLAAEKQNNSLLEAQKRELENLLEMQRNRTEALSSRITQLEQPSILNATQPIPDMPDVDDTLVPPLLESPAAPDTNTNTSESINQLSGG